MPRDSGKAKKMKTEAASPCCSCIFMLTFLLAMTLINSLQLLEAVSVPKTLRLPSELPRVKDHSDNDKDVGDSQQRLRPLIGIVSHPGDGCRGRLSKNPNVSYIAASYVKLVESGGARVVPILFNDPPEVWKQKLQAVNGLIFTGGSDKYGPLHDAVAKLFQYALEENDKGKYFPVYAICLGFEIVSMVVSENLNILQTFDASYYPSTVQFVNDAAKNRSIFKWFSADVISKISTEPIILENHKFGISVERFSQSDALSSFFRVLTTSFDRNNKEYVSTVEAYNYPVTATQWHPEKSAYEWQVPNIPHTLEAVEVVQGVANFIVSEARKSNHRATPQQEQDFVIYNYATHYSGKIGSSYDEVYLFP